MSQQLFPPPQSSPLSSAPASQRGDPVTWSQQIGQWRSARELPFEIQQFVRIYLEESLFTKALDFLLAIVTADVSSPQRKDVTVPPTEHLALLATLAVHPWLTTRATSEEKWAEASASLRLLQLLLRMAGPVTCNFKDAFRFKKLYDAKAPAENDEQSDDHIIRHPFASEDGIWNRADDFWAVVGWAMNCSCLPDMYASRWEHWQLWLDFVIDVLTWDWQYFLSCQRPNQSMLWMYLEQNSGDNNNHVRRVVRALFANGTKSSLNEFREIFRRELKAPKQNSEDVKEREAVDIDNEIYGDYLAQDDSDDTTDSKTQITNRTTTRALSNRRITPRTSRQSLHSDLEDDSSAMSAKYGHGLGPPEAVILRLRLIQLLIYVASEPLILSQSKSTSFLDLADLYTLFVEFIKSLPLLAFQQIISSSFCSRTASASDSSSRTLNVHVHTTLLTFLLQRLLETTSSTFSATSMTPLTQYQLEIDYLPYAANKSTADANARVSICIEGLLRNLNSAQLLKDSRDLQKAVEKGIERRKRKVAERKRERVNKDGEDEEEAMDWLVESSVRIKDVIRRLKT